MTGGFSARRGVERVCPRTLMQRGVLPLLVELEMNVFDLRSRLVSDYRPFHGTNGNSLIPGERNAVESGGLVCRNQGQVEVSGLALEMAELAVPAFALEVLDASLDICSA